MMDGQNGMVCFEDNGSQEVQLVIKLKKARKSIFSSGTPEEAELLSIP